MTDTIQIATTRRWIPKLGGAGQQGYERLAEALNRPKDSHQPDDVEYIRKAYADVKTEIKDGERAVIAAISTETVDRDQEVMLIKGADLTWFRKNPVVMYAHNYGGLPIGRAQWIRKEDHKLIAKTEFAPLEANPVAEQIYQLFAADFLRAFSIGFIVLDSREPKEGEFTENVKRVITKWQLLEYSVVPVPSNMEALAIAVGKGLELSDGLKADFGIDNAPQWGEDEEPPEGFKSIEEFYKKTTEWEYEPLSIGIQDDESEQPIS